MADTDISPTSAGDLNDTTTVSDSTQPQTSAQGQGQIDPNSASDNSTVQQTPDQTAARFPFPNNTTNQPATTPQPQPSQGAQIAQSIEQTPNTQPDYSNHPAVQKADLLHTIAETLAGGPRFVSKIDPLTGEMTRTKVPLSKGDIGMAIAASAIQGALAGLSVPNGPGNLGRAAGAGGAATMQNQQKIQNEQDQTANADFARHTQIFETNMRMHQNALAVGRQNFDQNERNVAQYAPMLGKIMNDHPEVIKGVVDEADLSKYNVTKENAIPYKTVQRLDPTTGKQATNSYGEPQWDTQYAIVDPDFKATDFLSDSDKALAAKLGLTGFVNSDGDAIKLPQDMAMKLSMGINLQSQLASYHIAEGTLNNYFDELNAHNASGKGANPQSIFQMYPKDEDLADFIKKQEASDKPGSRGERNNNEGNLVADKSWTGKIDDKNLPPSFKTHGIRGFRIYDSKAEGRQGLLNQLALDRSKMPNATPEQYFTKYSNPEEAPAYAAAARKNANVGGAPVPEPQEAENPHPPVDLLAAAQQDRTLLSTWNKFTPLLEAAKGNYEQAIGALGKADPNGAGKILNLLGGTSAVQQYDQKRATDVQAAKDAEAVQKQELLNPVMANRAAAEETARETAKNAVADQRLHDQINQAAGETPDNSGVRQNFYTQQDPGTQSLLKAIATGQQRVSSMGLSRTQQIDLAAKVQAAFPGFSQQTSNNYYQVADDVNRRKPLDNANIALEHLGQYFDAANRAGFLGTLPGVSTLIKNIGPAKSQQAVIDYQQARDRAGQEIESAYKGAGLTDKDAAHQRDLFEAGTPSAALDIAKAASKLLTAKYAAVDTRLANVMPSSDTPVQDLMSKDAHRAYQLMHNGQDFDAAASQRENQTNYGTWYGRQFLDSQKTARGGQAGNSVQPSDTEQKVTDPNTGKLLGYTKDGKTFSRLP